MGKRLIRYASRKWTLPLALVLLVSGLFLAAFMAFAADGEQQTSWTVYWVDNNNEAESRPSISGGEPAYGTPTLTVEIAGETYTYPSDNGAADQLLLDRLSLSAWPTPVITETGTGVWTVDYGEGGLPSLAYQVDEEGNVITQEPSGEEDEDGNPTLKPVEPSLPVTWTVTPPTVGDYVLTEVTEENLWEYPSVNDNCGWYYVLQDTVTFEFGLRWGTLKELDGITNAVLTAFQLRASYEGNSPDEISNQLIDLIGGEEVELQFQYWDEATGDWAPWGEDTAKEKDPTRARLVIGNAWRYNLDGSPVTYKVSAAYGEVEGGDKLYAGGLEENDYFLISYDNTNSTNHGSATDGAYDGGTVYLTLTGTIDYTAQKVWRDNDASDRPEVELQLWRYRAGEDLNTAAPVRDGNGEIYTWQNPEDQTIMVDALPKYDSEGHRYIYVVREYMEGGGYTQVFGELDEDGTVTKDVVYQLDEDGVARPNGTREAGNTYLYNGGTLNNVRSDTVTTQATKVWQAAAFQAEFEDVAVVLTLQSRPKDEGNWTNVTKSDGSTYTETLHEFTAETLSGTTVSASMPKYNNLGEELEYRWVETAVYQGGNSENLLRDRTFTLMQDDNITSSAAGGTTERAVQYTSITEVDETTGATTITNQLSGTIYYEVDKWWQVPVGELPENPGDDPGYKQVGGSWYTKNAPEDKTSVTFDLYRVISGETLGVGSEPYLTFTMNGEEIEITKKPNDATITTDSNGTWFGRLNGLPEFNEAGQQYEYILVEQGQSPTYDVNRYSEGYQTTVYNPTGTGGIRIMVQKQWIDDSDTAHREPVTIQAYSTEGPIDGATVTLKNGVWYGWIGLPGYGAEDINSISIHEVSMGSDEKYIVDDSNHVTTDHHRYEVTYSKPVPLGESANEFIATVTNRRLGNIDLTVTKTWNSGDGTEAGVLEAALDNAGLSLALRLEFHSSMTNEEYGITYTGIRDGESGSDTVNLGGEPVEIQDNEEQGTTSIQKIAVPTGENKTREYYFHNLPKYDLNGTTVRYAVVEGLVDGNGNFQTIGDYLASNPNTTLAEELRNWSVSYGEETYNSAVDGTEDEGKDLDTQVVPISNTLTGSKPVSWHKEWRDAYTYDQKQRPDIYLDIYQMVHDNDGTTHLELYQADYKWEQSTDEGSTDTANHWTATIAGVPKYDRLGYEITYYAVERTAVNAAAFDYAPVEYWFDTGGDGEEGPTKIGTRIEIEKAYEKEDYAASLKEIYDQTGSDLIHPYEGLPGYNFALAEGGIFRNQLSAALTLSGQKLWTNVPEAFAAVDLPPVTFTLSRSTEGGTDAVERAATLKVTDWASVQENGSYRFAFAYEGNWEMRRENGSTIYTAESGNTITVSDDGTVTYQPGEGDGTPGTGVPSWATPLPKYDEYGNRYIYTMEETSVWLPDDNGNLVPVPVEGEDQGGGETTSPEPTSTGGAETRSGEGTDGAAGEGGQTETSAVDLNVIFESISMDENAYRANNAYREGSGQLTVKKWLKLEQVDGKYVYPAVTVVLSRSYTSYSETGAATEKDEGVVATYTWTADDWEVASTGADENGWVSLTHTFGDLERYAPNGSEYTYTITEDKANLGGYDTWAVADDVANSPTETAMSEENKKNSIEIGNEPKEDDTEVDATFINQYIDEPGPDLETVTLTGTKVWDDWEGELRPEIDVMNGKSPPSPWKLAVMLLVLRMAAVR